MKLMKRILFKFAPIMPTHVAFCFCLPIIPIISKINASLQLAYFEILLLYNQRRFKPLKQLNVGATLLKYLGGSGDNSLTVAQLQNTHVFVIGINKNINA